MFMTEDGIDISVNDLQDEKVNGSITVIEAHKETRTNLRHPLKHPSPIIFMEEGIESSVNEEQSKNAFLPIVVTVFGMIIFCNDKHP